MHCFVDTLLPIVIPAIFLHNFRLNPVKGIGEENLNQKIKKDKSQPLQAEKIQEDEGRWKNGRTT